MTTKFGLGRGLSALIPGAPVHTSVSTTSAGGQAVLVVPPERIHANPQQPRRSFPQAELDALVASIRSHGILQPLVVTLRPDGAYELVVGERRLRAAKLAGLATVPVIVRDGEHNGRAKLELALIENIQRQDLDPIDRALAYQQLVEEYGLTQEEVATRVGIARSTIAHTIRLLALPTDMQAALRDGRFSEGHAKLLVSMTDAAEQRAWFERILAQRVSVATIAAERGIRHRPVAQQDRSSVGDPNLRAKELELQRRLGARVRITPYGRGGVIAITYTNAEELHGILRAIQRLPAS